MLATRPNVNPPVITTGVGPHGRKIVYTQPPDGMSSADSTASDNDFAGSSGIFDVALPAAPDPQRQYRTLLEAMAAAQAALNGEVGAEVLPIAPHSEPAANKENTIPVIPPSTPYNTISSSSYAKAMIDKAKSNVKKLPPKPTLEETLIKLSTFVISSL
jgi:hypothetical protein